MKRGFLKAGLDRPTATNRHGFGGPNGAVDTIIITFEPETRQELLKHEQFYKSLANDLPAFNARNIGIVPIPGKGLCMIAKRDIAAGELFLRERPLLVLPENVPEDFLPTLDTIMRDEMTPTRRAPYWKLHKCKPSGEDMPDLINIYQTNSTFVIFPFQDEACSGVFEVISRANHSCTPNAEYLFDYDSFCGELQAMFPIKAGDQIFIAYINFLLPAAERRALLRERYYFTCDCDACNPRSSTFAKSEVRRKLIRALLPGGADGQTDVDRAEALRGTHYGDREIDRILGFLDQERLPAGRPGVWLRFAQFEMAKARETHQYGRAAELAKKGIAEANRLGFKKKTMEWFKLEDIHYFCEDEDPAAVKHGQVADDGLENLSVDELLQRLLDLGSS